MRLNQSIVQLRQLVSNEVSVIDSPPRHVAPLTALAPCQEKGRINRTKGAEHQVRRVELTFDQGRDLSPDATLFIKGGDKLDIYISCYSLFIFHKVIL